MCGIGAKTKKYNTKEVQMWHTTEIMVESVIHDTSMPPDQSLVKVKLPNLIKLGTKFAITDGHTVYKPWH